jgi:hypothetical protein
LFLAYIKIDHRAVSHAGAQILYREPVLRKSARINFERSDAVAVWMIELKRGMEVLGKMAIRGLKVVGTKKQPLIPVNG